MRTWPEARRRWREGRIGRVSLASPRGVGALLLFGLATLAAFYGPLVQLASLFVEQEAPPDPRFTLELLVLNLGFNVAVLLILPVLAIVVSRPGEPGAVANRLRLYVTPRTGLHVVVGVVVTVLAMVLLGGILWALDAADIYHAEESDLVPQIQALLTWPLVIAIPLVAAVTEEVYFRGLLQPRIGLWASSFLFGVVHLGYGTVLQVVAPVLLGLLFGLLYQRTQTLWAPIAAHFTFDFVELGLLLLEREGYFG